MEITKAQYQGQELLTELVVKAWESATFKEQLIQSPQDTIEKAVGQKMTLPENSKIVVEDQTDPNIVYLNIPRKANINNLELTDEQLELVSGGEFVVAGVAIAIVGLFGAGVGIGLAISAIKD